MPNLYIIAGCNGSGKTTASFTILPEVLNCKEFVNADEIASGLSPFQPEKVAIQAGKLMLKRIDELILEKVDFAFETTLASKTYLHKIKKAKSNGYEISLIFLWLENKELAIDRVALRVQNGGHHIHDDIVRRRYERGLFNFFNYFKFEVDNWSLFDNSQIPFKIIAEGGKNDIQIVYVGEIWNTLVQKYNNKLL